MINRQFIEEDNGQMYTQHEQSFIMQNDSKHISIICKFYKLYMFKNNNLKIFVCVKNV